MTNDRFDANKWYIQQRTSPTLTASHSNGGLGGGSSSRGTSSGGMSSGGISSGGISISSGGFVSPPPPVYPPISQPQPKKNHLSIILCILSILSVIIVALILIVIISDNASAYSQNDSGFYSAIISQTGNGVNLIEQFIKSICFH